jgi:hypothetical protein
VKQVTLEGGGNDWLTSWAYAGASTKSSMLALGLDLEVRPLIAIGVITEKCDGCGGFIKDREAGLKFRDEQTWLAEAGVDHHGVASVELTIAFAFVAEGFEKFSGGIEVMNFLRAVAHSDEN